MNGGERSLRGTSLQYGKRRRDEPFSDNDWSAFLDAFPVVKPPTKRQMRRAAMHAVDHSNDRDEARMFLSMLGMERS